MSPLMTTTEAAQYLRIHRLTLTRLVDAGKINAVTHSDLPGARLYFRQPALDAYLEERERPRAPKPRKRAVRVVDESQPWLTSA